jgi:hypothetical protein
LPEEGARLRDSADADAAATPDRVAPAAKKARRDDGGRGWGADSWSARFEAAFAIGMVVSGLLCARRCRRRAAPPPSATIALLQGSPPP